MAEFVEDVHGIGRQLHARTDFAELLCPFEDVVVEAVEIECVRSVTPPIPAPMIATRGWLVMVVSPGLSRELGVRYR